MDYTTIQLSDSRMAAAALFIAMRMNNFDGWNESLEFYSGEKRSFLLQNSFNKRSLVMQATNWMILHRLSFCSTHLCTKSQRRRSIPLEISMVIRFSIPYRKFLSSMSTTSFNNSPRSLRSSPFHISHSIMSSQRANRPSTVISISWPRST